MKSLIIVESPSKAKTISKFLGDDYIVVASKGHIRDLPKNKIGITIENNDVIPEYKTTDDHRQVVSQITSLAKKANKVYLATDEDREGEAISWHIAHILNQNPMEMDRIAFHEITKSAIMKALENPRKLDMNAVDAQQARRLLDRLVGYNLSPLLSVKIQRGLSAGRVQSAALKIIVDREREINNFTPITFYTHECLINNTVQARLEIYNGEKLNSKLPMTDLSLAEQALADSKVEPYKVVDIESKETRSKASPPFMTSTLQQTASNKLGYSTTKTMQIAQKLYEGVPTPNGTMGAITYMRTDSLNLAKEAIDSVRNYIANNFDKEYLPQSPNIYTTKAKGAQEAHEAIRPTNVEFTPDIAKRYLEEDEWKLYNLIWSRYVACQMTPTIANVQNVYFSNEKTIYKASGRTILFPGFSIVYGTDDKDKILPNFSKGEIVKASDFVMNTKQTEPPARFNEASMVKKLEELGIGRPSTYAPTISLLKSRKYVELNGKQLVPTPISFKIIEMLEQHFPDIVDSAFTSMLETQLDHVAEGKIGWKSVLLDFYNPFISKITEGRSKIASQKELVLTDEICPKCNTNKLAIRNGRYGKFIACSGFPKCKYIKPPEDQPHHEESHPITTGIKCDKCKDGEMVEKSGKRGKFLACNNYPKCKNTKPIPKVDKPKVPKE